MLDKVHLTLALTEAKKEALLRTCKKLLACRELALWDLVSLLGNCNWATAIGQTRLPNLFTKYSEFVH
jgi:hypothetical protein